MGMNGYDFFLGKTRFPVTPSKLELKIKGQNKTLTLINDGEINFLKLPGLTDISVDFLLPAADVYPFAEYPEGFQPPDYYLGILEDLKTKVQEDVMNGVTQFIVCRTTVSGELFDTNIKVSVEDYNIKESADEGRDIIVSLKLKQYKDFATKNLDVQTHSSGNVTATVARTRETANAPKASSVTVQSGDTLMALAKKYYGDGSRYLEIAKANGIDNPNLIITGQELKIP